MARHWWPGHPANGGVAQAQRSLLSRPAEDWQRAVTDGGLQTQGRPAACCRWKPRVRCHHDHAALVRKHPNRASRPQVRQVPTIACVAPWFARSLTAPPCVWQDCIRAADWGAAQVRHTRAIRGSWNARWGSCEALCHSARHVNSSHIQTFVFPLRSTRCLPPPGKYRSAYTSRLVQQGESACICSRCGPWWYRGVWRWA